MTALFLLLGPLLALADSLADKGFVDISAFPHVKVDLRYATTNNFMGQNLYGDFKTPYLHPIAAEKLKHAGRELQSLKPGWTLLVFDALRPRSVQRRLYDAVKGTPSVGYVMSPEKGSLHNFGFAIDLSLADENGREVDMGTAFDNFTELAQPRLETKMLREGRLTTKQVANRRILRSVMEKAGFKQVSNEWWHFDALPGAVVRKKYKIVE